MTDRVAVVGGGILGVAIAREILTRRPDAQVTLFEKEDRLAAHQTGHNSGVVHAGLYYEPGSAKATLCRRGVVLLQEFCEQHGIRRIECGKVLVALDDVERARLSTIEARALANGVPGVRTIGPDELRELEPHVRGIAALHSPTTSIVDFAEVTRSQRISDFGALWFQMQEPPSPGSSGQRRDHGITPDVARHVEPACDKLPQLP